MPDNRGFTCLTDRIHDSIRYADVAEDVDDDLAMDLDMR